MRTVKSYSNVSVLRIEEKINEVFRSEDSQDRVDLVQTVKM